MINLKKKTSPLLKKKTRMQNKNKIFYLKNSSNPLSTKQRASNK